MMLRYSRISLQQYDPYLAIIIEANQIPPLLSGQAQRGLFRGDLIAGPLVRKLREPNVMSVLNSGRPFPEVVTCEQDLYFNVHEVVT